MRFALACNRSTHYQVGSDRPEDELEEFDSPETVDAIAQAIASFGHDVKILEADKTFPEALARGRFEFVFNIAEGLSGRARESQVPAVCDMLGIPYTGSDAVTIGVTLDKDLAKRVLTGIVPVAKGKLFRNPDEIDLGDMTFPLFVKPNGEGSSKGIRNASKIENHRGAKKRISELIDQYAGPVLVEEFLGGPECTIGVLGNENPRIIGIMEIRPKHVPIESFVYSLETKRDYLNQVEYHAPPGFPKKTIVQIEKIVLNVFRALECRDFARVDIRLDDSGNPKFLEVNPLPGLAPIKSDIVILSRLIGLEYRKLIGEILEHALHRNGFSC